MVVFAWLYAITFIERRAGSGCEYIAELSDPADRRIRGREIPSDQGEMKAAVNAEASDFARLAITVEEIERTATIGPLGDSIFTRDDGEITRGICDRCRLQWPPVPRAVRADAAARHRLPGIALVRIQREALGAHE